jgi:hypothetical protein
VLYVEGMNECRWSQTVEKRVDRYSKIAIDLEREKPESKQKPTYTRATRTQGTRFRARFLWCPLFHAT